MATNKPAAPVHDAMEQGGVGFHGEVRPPRTSDYEPAAVPFGKDEFAGMRGRYNEHGSRHGYNPASVNAAIASSTRAGRRIGGKEASAIHRLLKGR